MAKSLLSVLFMATIQNQGKKTDSCLTLVLDTYAIAFHLPLNVWVATNNRSVVHY